MLVYRMGTGDYNASTTELESHANIIVVGKQAFVFSHSGQSVDVKAFTEGVGGLSKVPIVDGVISYDCPHSGETLLIVVRNYFCVLGIEHNLLTPFILHEAGLAVNDTPKIHIDDPSVGYHSIFDVENKLIIPFQLSGIFLEFQTCSLNEEEIENVKHYPSVLLTPDSNKWDPYDFAYAFNENSFLERRGDMMLRRTTAKRTLVDKLDLAVVEYKGD